MAKMYFSYTLPKKGLGADGYVHPLYKARRELICIRCRRTIAPGEHFTRQKHPNVQDRNKKIYPCCATCYPFTEVDHSVGIETHDSTGS
jgi:hypothetical protein